MDIQACSECNKIKCLRTLKRKYFNCPTDRTKVKPTNLQEEVQLMIVEAKLQYESNLALAYAHSKIFQYISSIKGHDRYPTSMFYNEKQATSDSDKAQLFNEYFYSVYTSGNQPIAR